MTDQDPQTSVDPSVETDRTPGEGTEDPLRPEPTDSRGGDRYVRLSFAAGYDAVAQALDRIMEFQRG